MTRSYLEIIHNLKTKLTGLYGSSEYFYYSINAVGAFLALRFIVKLARKQYLKKQFKEISLCNSKGELKFKECKDWIAFTVYNSNFSSTEWWQKNLKQIESILGQRLLKVEIKTRKFRQNKIVLLKDKLPKVFKKVITSLKPLEFNGGINQYGAKLKESLLNKSGVGLFMNTDQGKTALALAILIDLIYSFRDTSLSPVLLVSAPKDSGADFVKLKSIYKNVEIYDTSTNKGLKAFIDRFKSASEEMKNARELAIQNGLAPNHDIKIPEKYLYSPFFVVLDEIFQTIKTKGVSKERKELALELQQLTDKALRQWRTKLSAVLILSQDASLSELENIAYHNIGIRYYGTIKSTLKPTGLLPSDDLYDRKDFGKGKFLIQSTTYHDIVRTPFYGESDTLKNIPFNFKKLELKNGKRTTKNS